MWGYDPRDGLESKASSLEGCKNNCDSRPDCKAFQYSAIEGSGCQLLNIDSPTMPRRSGIDFCLKQGTTWRLLNYSMIHFTFYQANISGIFIFRKENNMFCVAQFSKLWMYECWCRLDSSKQGYEFIPFTRLSKFVHGTKRRRMLLSKWSVWLLLERKRRCFSNGCRDGNGNKMFGVRYKSRPFLFIDFISKFSRN